MIVKNEEKQLARCLLSAKPIVDEIVIVDTGSEDKTRTVSEVFGARVFDFAWRDDFSAARNFSISKATGDWILVLDADEALPAKDRDTLKEVLAEVKTRPAAFRIQTRNYSNQLNTIGFRQNQGEYPEEQGVGWHSSHKVRLFTNDPRIRFEYPVHELVEPCLERLQIPVKECPVAVHHYGTLEASATLEKSKIYRKLEEKKLQKRSRNPAALRELAVQSAQLGNYSEALELWRRYLRLQPHSAEACLNMGSAYFNLGRYPEAVKFAEKASRLAPRMKEARFNLALALLCMGSAGRAQSILEELAHTETNYPAGQFLLCTACACQGEMNRFETELSKLRSSAVGLFLGESFFDIAEKLAGASQTDYARRTIEAAVSANYTSTKMKALLSNCRTAA